MSNHLESLSSKLSLNSTWASLVIILSEIDFSKPISNLSMTTKIWNQSEGSVQHVLPLTSLETNINRKNWTQTDLSLFQRKTIKFSHCKRDQLRNAMHKSCNISRERGSAEKLKWAGEPWLDLSLSQCIFGPPSGRNHSNPCTIPGKFRMARTHWCSVVLCQEERQRPHHGREIGYREIWVALQSLQGCSSEASAKWLTSLLGYLGRKPTQTGPILSDHGRCHPWPLWHEGIMQLVTADESPNRRIQMDIRKFHRGTGDDQNPENS